ncbi:DUF6161 domain-containing protein [Pseudophaeobacter arcticus]
MAEDNPVGEKPIDIEDIPPPSIDERNLKQRMQRLENSRISENERVSLARDVHHDVLSLLTAMEQSERQVTYVSNLNAEYYEGLQLAKEKQRRLRKELEETTTELSNATSRITQEIDEHRNNTLAAFEKGVSAAQAAFTEQQAIREPVVLWKEKQREHETAKRWGLGLFTGGLLIAAGFVVALIYGLATQPDYVQALLAPIGCDPKQPSSACSGFSLKGVLLAAGVLTLFTLLLWFIRLQMKLYLAERHLGLDAREREAFAQSYLGLVREGDVSEEAKEQRALVYAALFRPASDGTVKDEGGLDPSVTAALAKFLMKP